jgi:hypothetical protein
VIFFFKRTLEVVGLVEVWVRREVMGSVAWAGVVPLVFSWAGRIGSE